MSNAAWSFEQSLIEDAKNNPPVHYSAFAQVTTIKGKVLCGRVIGMWWDGFYYRWMYELDCFNNHVYSTHPEDKIERAIFSQPELRAYMRVYSGDRS